MKMYKLFVTRFTNRLSPHGVFFVPKPRIVQHAMRLCSFCNFYHRKMPKLVKHHQLHNYTTTVNILGQPPVKKKIKKRSKKYAEPLAVRNETKTNKTTEVHKGTAPNLSVPIDHSDISTQDSCGINDSIFNETLDSKFVSEENHSFSQNETYLNIENNPGMLPESEVSHDMRLHINDEVFDNSDKYHGIEDSDNGNSSTVRPAKNKANKMGKLNNTRESKKLKAHPQRKMELHKHQSKYTLRHYVETFLAYMEVYVSCGLLSKANSSLMRYRKYTLSKVKSCDECVKLYNVLLEAYASRRKVTKVLELYDIIKNDSVTPTPQTYVYIFDALGRENINNERLALLKKLDNEMNSYNISFHDVISKSYFKNDQRENVLKVIRVLMPRFEPLYTKLDTTYECKLLHEIPMNRNYESPTNGLLTLEELKDLAKLQIEAESKIEVEIPSIEACKQDIKSIAKLKEQIMEVESYWRNVALAAFERNLKNLKQKESQLHNDVMVLYPFFEVLDKEDYVNAILREIKQIARGSETYSTSLKSLYISLGKFIYKKYEIKTKTISGAFDKVVHIYIKYIEWYLHPEDMPHLSNLNNRTVWKHFEQEATKHGPSADTTCRQWHMDVIVNIGKFLYDIILNDIILQPDMLKGHDLKCSVPAFYTLFRNKGAYLSEQIKPHPLVSKLYKDSYFETLTFDSLVVPSHGPPRPWTSIYSGGYIMTKTDFIRVPDYTDAPWRKLQNTAMKNLFPIFDSLNQLSSVPWKINTPILDIIIKIFRDGGSEKLNVPRSVSVLSPPPPISKNATPEEKQKGIIALARFRQHKYELYSLWCDALYKLSIANYFREKVFWLPHNLDFRGRVYPVPPHLNHLSSDLGRSLLKFAKGKPLGPNGLNWLKVHVINLTNFKKGTSLQKRLKYANENMENILDSAAKPLTGKMWWTKSEEPWQTLAGCMEIASALQAPDIEQYVSTFPVHQDGSCNGLQHYAALGRDQIGAESVNLYPFDTPRDVYTAVANTVEEQRLTDAANNVKLATVLEGFVKRKVIKQTVMTTVYGVTKYGAKNQIARQLKDTANFPEDYVWSASLYLTERTFNSLRTMFKSAREIQDWFTVCARIISSNCFESVEWITPLGLPIVQPYTKRQKSHKTFVKDNEKPDSMKQKNAFAPNFIHSLDSTHMMLTSLHCNQENVTFVSVHDCFWTHPCTIEAMNRICRQQFVALHSEPILEDLAKFFVKRYAPTYENLHNADENSIQNIRKCLTSIPSKGTFDIKKVLLSTYFFN